MRQVIINGKPFWMVDIEDPWRQIWIVVDVPGRGSVLVMSDTSFDMSEARQAAAEFIQPNFPHVLETTLPETLQRCWVFPLTDDEMTWPGYVWKGTRGPHEEGYLVVSDGPLDQSKCWAAVDRTFDPTGDYHARTKSQVAEGLQVVDSGGGSQL